MHWAHNSDAWHAPVDLNVDDEYFKEELHNALCAWDGKGKRVCWAQGGKEVYGPLHREDGETERFCELDAQGRLTCEEVRSSRPDCENTIVKTPSGRFKQLYVSGDVACALDDKSGVSCWGPWFPTMIPGAAMKSRRYLGVAAAGDWVCGIERRGGETRCWSGGQPVESFKSIAFVGHSTVCAFDAAQRLQCNTAYEPVGGMEQVLKGKYRQFFVYEEGLCGWKSGVGLDCVGVGAATTAYRGAFVEVKGIDKGVCGRVAAGSVICVGDVATPAEGQFKRIEVRNGEDLCGVRADGSEQCWLKKEVVPSWDLPPKGHAFVATHGPCGVTLQGEVYCNTDHQFKVPKPLPPALRDVEAFYLAFDQ